MSGQTIECSCWTVLRGANEDAVITEAQAHAKAVHDMDLSKRRGTLDGTLG